MASTQFTIEDLKRILSQAAGYAGEDLADGDILDMGFEDLGYDSLALLEIGGRIEREFGLELEDSTLTDAATPRALVEVINEQLGVEHAS